MSSEKVILLGRDELSRLMWLLEVAPINYRLLDLLRTR